MVWLAEKKVFHHILDMGFERIDIPVRVKFNFEVKEGAYVPDSLSKEILYNLTAIKKHYPKLRLASLEDTIENMVEDQIMEYFRLGGLLKN